jgi:two-component system, NarL family, sensor histidine kinase UhpB
MSPRRGRYVPLLHRVAAINAALVIVAVAVTIVVLAPGKISAFAVDEEVIVVLAAVALVVATNVYLLRRVVGPVQALTALARRVDLTSLGQRMPAGEPASEAGELAQTFNEMLSRLESERRESTGRVLRAQEAERLRIAQELHDQVGQELTAVLLGLSRIASLLDGGVRDDVRAVQDAVRFSLEDVRRIAIELRPEALDDLGLTSALAVLAERLSQRFGLDVSERIAADLPALPVETELVVYRVAQEALTNVARHSGSSRAELTLEHVVAARARGHDDGGRLSLRVRDYGRGLRPQNIAGTGMRGMRERAALIGASLDIGNMTSGPGCEVRLDVPLDASVEGPSIAGPSIEGPSVGMPSVGASSVEASSVRSPPVAGPSGAVKGPWVAVRGPWVAVRGPSVAVRGPSFGFSAGARR